MLKVGRTIADLDHSERVTSRHIGVKNKLLSGAGLQPTESKKFENFKVFRHFPSDVAKTEARRAFAPGRCTFVQIYSGARTAQIVFDGSCSDHADINASTPGGLPIFDHCWRSAVSGRAQDGHLRGSCRHDPLHGNSGESDARGETCEQ
ncbi:MAG: hypothetical protein ACR2NN_04230 [Bryobacteraceae bacterium]